MPRRLRNQSKSKIYHVMIRGNERKNIFLDEEDKIRFIDTLYKLIGLGEDGSKLLSEASAIPVSPIKEKSFNIYAYCLMDNHVHLVINEGEDNISRIMKRIQISYAYYFNNKYSRIGHLFQDRFKSEAIENDAYLLTAARYIHNNPVKAGIVEKASLYEWSSYNEYVKGKKSKGLVERNTILDMFSVNKITAVKLFIEYTNTESEDRFVEYVELEESKEIPSLKDAKSFIAGFLDEKQIELTQLAEKKYFKIRNELIQELREKSTLSIRQIADIVGVNRGVVQRIEKD